MADKQINELEAATAVTATDLFVLQQAGTAKKLESQVLENWLLAMAQGRGGIISIAKTGSAGTDPVVDTYTITFSDTSTTTFEVTNGLKGDTGDQTYVYIKYSNRDPIADSDLTDTPSDWMGICSTTASTAPTTYTSYAWYEIKGDKGDTGDSVTVASTSVTYQEWSSGTQYPTGTWVANPPQVTQGNYLWTRTIVNYSDGGQTVSYSVARNGLDGSGAVSSVNNNLPDNNGNVTLTASDVGALPDSYQPPVTSVNGDTGAVVLDYEDVGAVHGLTVSKALSTAGWYRAVKMQNPTGTISRTIDFTVTRNYNNSDNETHCIKHIANYNSFSFNCEVSKCNTQLVDKIRYTTDATYGYIDIHYTGSYSNTITVDFVCHSYKGMVDACSAETLQSVADAPSGETVVTNFTLSSSAAPVTSPTYQLTSGSISGTGTASYTATQPCWFYLTAVLQASSRGYVTVKINNIVIAEFDQSETINTNPICVPVPMQTGDTINVSVGSNKTSTYKVFAMRGQY